MLRQLILILFLITATAKAVKADVGWTYAQCVKAWGSPIETERLHNRDGWYLYTFKINSITVVLVEFNYGHVVKQSEPVNTTPAQTPDQMWADPDSD
jgi:hypothetical protein